MRSGRDPLRRTITSTVFQVTAPRITQKSCRPRVSDRTMVGNSATRLACEFQRTERRRHDEHETPTGRKKHGGPVAPRLTGPLRDRAPVFLPSCGGFMFVM